MDTVERTTPADNATYDAFISYSHAADGLLAPRLQSALQRFARPWWKRRALRIFRDESSLSANPHLWSSITKALDASGWFVLLLSPDAAQSQWVNQEIEYWIEHKDPSRILPVVTDGHLDWDGDVTGDAAPEALRGVFSEEPRWVDLCFARDEEQLDLNNPRFSSAVADIASALRGVPKDELESEEVKQHRRTIRTAWAAAFLVLLLGVAAVVAAIQSSRNAAEAERQAEIAAQNEATAVAEAERADASAAEAEKSAAEAEQAAQLARARELASASIANLERNPELATLLALTALDRAPGTDDPPVELVNAIWQAGSSNRLVDVIESGGEGFGLSPNGSRLAVVESENVLEMYDAQTLDLLWDYSEETLDSFQIPVISPDGRTALAVFDAEEDDGLSNRLLIFDSEGRLERSLEFPDCAEAGDADWSPDASFLAVGAVNGCPHAASPQWIEVFETDTWESVAFLPVEGRGDQGLRPRFDGNGRLYGMRPFEQAVIFETETFELVEVSEATGMGDVAPDGSRIYGFYALQGQFGEAGSPFSVLAFDTASGEVADVLYTGNRYPSFPGGVLATDDGQYVVVSTDHQTHVYEPVIGQERFSLPTGSFLLAYDAERELLYTSTDDVQVWDLGASALGVTSTGDLGSYTWVNGNSFEVGADFVAFAAIDLAEGRWQTVVFDPETGSVVDILRDSEPVTALANGRYVLFVRDESSAAHAIYDPATAELHRFLECSNFVEGVGCDEPGHHLVTSLDGEELLAFPIDSDGELAGQVYDLDVDTGQILSVEPIDEDQLWIDTFTDSWVMGSPTRTIDITVYDRVTGDVRWHDEENHDRYEIAPLGRMIATWSSDSVQMVETDTWASFVIDGFNEIRGGAFNAAGTLVAIGDADALRIIEVETGQIAQQIHLGGISDIYFIDDENLVIGTNTGILGTVSISTNDLIERTRDNLRRSFTEQECVTYQIDPCPTLEEMRAG